jgi:hypothetical protein
MCDLFFQRILASALGERAETLLKMRGKPRKARVKFRKTTQVEVNQETCFPSGGPLTSYLSSLKDHNDDDDNDTQQGAEIQ